MCKNTKLLILTFIVIPIFSHACDKGEAARNGFSAIYEKYPEYKHHIGIFTIEEHDGIWLLLRKQQVFKAQPKEYPRAVIDKKSCNVTRVVWSK